MFQKFTIYQLLPRLFGNRCTKNIPSGTIEENGCGKFNDITDKALKSIKGLGITHVWYTGIIAHATQTDYSKFGIAGDHSAIVKGKAGSPYAIKDYYDVDPDLAEDVPARMQEFEALITRTHNAGLKALIDFIPNHVARQYHSAAKPCGIKDLGEDDNSNVSFSPHNNFYYLPNQLFAGQFNLLQNESVPYHEYPAKASGNDVFSAFPTINDWYETVKLNYGIDYQAGRTCHFNPTPDTWFKMRDILFFWAEKGVDGFRCDMAEMVPVEFWGWAIPQIKQRFADVIFIAEVYTPSLYRSYIDFGKFDYLYDKVGMYDTLRSIICGEAPARNISVAWQKVNDILPRMLFFLENHDEQRIASPFFAGDPQLALPAMIVACTLSIAPTMIYFGQELGEAASGAEGFSGNDGRTTIFDYWGIPSINQWNNNGKWDAGLLFPQQQKLRSFYRRLLTISLHEKAICQGDMFDLMYVNYNNPCFNPEKQFACFRKQDNDLLLICVNFDTAPCDVEIRIPDHAFDYLQLKNGKTVAVFELLEQRPETPQPLSSAYPFHVRLEASSGKILKLDKNDERWNDKKQDWHVEV